MFLKTEKQYNRKVLSLRQNTKKINILFEPKIVSDILNYKNVTRNFGKTNFNFKTNLTLSQLSTATKNKYINNDSKENNVIYLNINKAPSIVDNNYQINKLIQMKRREGFNKINNIYSQTLINEAQAYRKNLYLTATNLKSSSKIILSRNNSCNDFYIKNFGRKYRAFKKSYSVKNQINSYNKLFNFKTPTKLQSTILKDKKILSTLENTNIEKETNHALNSLTKMNMELVNSLHNEYITLKKLDNIEERLIKFKIIQNIQDENVKSTESKNEFIKDIYLKRLQNLKQILQKKNENYKKNIQSYLLFLNNKFYSLKEEVHIQNIEKFKICDEIEKIMIKIITMESELEYLLKIRNFLLKIKNEFSNNEQPLIYYDLLLMRDSKILLIEDIINNINFIKKIPNKQVKQFINHLETEKNKILNGYKDLNLNQAFLNSMDLGNYQLNEIFDSKELLIKMLDNLKDKNINLLYTLQKITRENNNLKIIYEKDIIKNQSINAINEAQEFKEKLLIRENLIKKNKILNKKYAYYNKNINDELNPKKYKLKKNRGKNMNLFWECKINLDSVNREKYQKELKNYKYNGLMLLEKLINIIKYFLNLNYAKEDFFQNCKNRNKLYFLDINISLIKETDIKTINTNILKAISFYEEICKYTIFTHEKLKLNKNNLNFIQEQENIINYKKRKNNSIKEMLAKIEKEEEDRKKTYEKAVKPILFFPNKINCENKILKNVIKNARKREIAKHLDEIEFNELVKYNN